MYELFRNVETLREIDNWSYVDANLSHSQFVMELN